MLFGASLRVELFSVQNRRSNTAHRVEKPSWLLLDYILSVVP